MDFFSQQDKARRNTSVLVVLFLAAVLTLITLTNVILATALMVLDSSQGGVVDTLYSGQFSQQFSWQRFGHISLAVCGVIACAIAYKWFQLSSGGKAVAESLGGSRVNPNSTDGGCKRVLNVVEEMAIASGMPVPPVYLLADEMGINAFAAGNTPADAVIGVTRGTVEQLNREQLQGVVAHEFSHILNGDMRLNIRLIALLNGILFIGSMGNILLRGGGYGRRSYTTTSSVSRSRSGNAQLAMLGLALIIVGWLGGFFGSLIKAAVSRQREFLADASAVQFTRNPEGIAGALKIIGGYSPGTRLINPHAREVSHLFFGQALNLLQATFATHPPLSERIARIEPSWNGQFIKRSSVRRGESYPRQKKPVEDHGLNGMQAAAVMAAAAAVGAAAILPDADFEKTVDDVREGIDALPLVLREQMHEPYGAMAIAYSLLLNADAVIQERQVGYIRQAGISGLALQSLQLMPELSSLDRALHMPVLELAVPALKCMSLQQYKVFKKTLLLLIKSDKQLEIFEWCLYQMLRHYLDGEFGLGGTGRPRYKKVEHIAAEYQLVLSLLATSGSSSAGGFQRGAQAVGLDSLVLLAEAQCTLDEFSKAVTKLSHCFPLLKPKLLKGLAECVKHDGKISPPEREILLSIAAVMDCPMPRLGSE
jgi:Zn-dependent protease with chaperone function